MNYSQLSKPARVFGTSLTHPISIRTSPTGYIIVEWGELKFAVLPSEWEQLRSAIDTYIKGEQP